MRKYSANDIASHRSKVTVFKPLFQGEFINSQHNLEQPVSCYQGERRYENFAPAKIFVNPAQQSAAVNTASSNTGTVGLGQSRSLAFGNMKNPKDPGRHSPMNSTEMQPNSEQNRSKICTTQVLVHQNWNEKFNPTPPLTGVTKGVTGVLDIQ